MFTFNVTHQNVSLHLTILSAHVLSDKKNISKAIFVNILNLAFFA